MRRRLLRIGQAMTCLALLVLATDVAFAQRGGRGRRGRDDGAPKVGEKAPLFKLKELKGKKTVDLAQAIKARPVVLFFGSYT